MRIFGGFLLPMETYLESALTIDKQFELLKSRGLVFEDENFARHVLETVSYYRLKSFLFPFRRMDGTGCYLPDATFGKVWEHYRFDRKLRFLLMDAVERIEVAVKTLVVNHFSLKYGAFGHRDIRNFADFADVERHAELLRFLEVEMRRSQEEDIRSFIMTFDVSSGLPLWMAAELMTFGNVLTFFKLMKNVDKQAIASRFGLSRQVFESWFVSLNYIRNVCAHHVRVWNRNLAVSPIIPKKLSEWHEEDYPVERSRIYSILCLAKVLLKTIAPQSKWPERLKELLVAFPDISRRSMGIPADFEQSSLWKSEEDIDKKDDSETK